MVPELREKFNSEFKPENYAAFIEDLQHSFQRSLGFRVCETPFFLSPTLHQNLVEAAEGISLKLSEPAFAASLERAIPAGLRVPREEPYSHFLQIDFAITRTDSGEIVPRLIELQGFPSLFGFQYVLNKKIRRYFNIPDDWTSYFNGLSGDAYLEMLKRLILGDCDPQEVILLEIEPQRQVTRIDFYCMHQLLGIPTVCISDLIRRGRHLVYRQQNREIPVRRIYNRIVFEEAIRTKTDISILLAEDVNVTWVGHPNWFFKLSKYVLPVLDSPYCPPCHYLADLGEYPPDLDTYVLKPLFSFAGGGVQVGPTRETLDAVKDRSNYVLQRKVEYAPVIKTPQGYSKAEVRMMFLWDGRFRLVNNLVRTSRGKLMGTSANRDETWVGATIALHRHRPA